MIRPLPAQIARLALSGLLFWLPATVFFKLADDIREHDTFRFDAAFLQWIHTFATPTLNRVALFATTLGNASTVVIITLLIAAYLGYKKYWRQLVFFLASIGGAATVDALLKLLFHRARPAIWSPIITETDYSFPSGHAMISMALAASLCVLLWNTRWRWAAVLLGCLYVASVGLSRLYLGVHFPTDILAGWCASVVWVGIAARVSRV